MVSDMNSEILYTEADESELDDLLSGRGLDGGAQWGQFLRPSGPRRGSTGVIWIRGNVLEPPRPLVLISHEDEIRRLCGRYSQLHSDLSPLSAWCHLITPKYLDSLDSLIRKPDLGGMQAAWTGLAVAESVLLAQKPLSSIRISACLATQSYAIARANALWGHVSLKEIRTRFDIASRICRSNSEGPKAENRATSVRQSFEPLWETLLGLSQGEYVTRAGELGPLIEALVEFRRAKAGKLEDESRYLVRYLSQHVPEASQFERLGELSPELRLRLFDALIAGLRAAKAQHSNLQRNACALLAGYLATVAAGGATSLTLAEDIANEFPEVTGWAYLIGGIGETIVWTSSFDGLGRLVAREILRPFRLDDSPTCDFSLDEANVLVDPKIADPLVHLRIKQARILNVSIIPGVNISLPLHDSASLVGGRGEQSQRMLVSDPTDKRDPIGAFVDAFWPHLKIRIDDYMRSKGRIGNDDSEIGEQLKSREKGRTDAHRHSSSKTPRKS